MTSIADLDTLTDDDLLAEAGRAILSDDMGMESVRLRDLVTAGERWLEKKKEELCHLVCTNTQVIKAFETGVSRQDLAALILDIFDDRITQIAPVPAATASLLFVRQGYYQLCSRYRPGCIH